jgi:hypothetical protein
MKAAGNPIMTGQQGGWDSDPSGKSKRLIASFSKDELQAK